MMNAEAKLNILTFVNDVALFGARISHVFHNYASLERHVDRRLPSRLGHLNAIVQTLSRLAELIKAETNENCLLDDQAFNYVETLADECAVTIGRMIWVMTGDRAWRNVHAPWYWKSVAIVNSKGQKELRKPEIDELAIYQGLKASKRNGKFGQIGGTSNRFEELQLHLLLVVQVISIHNMTKMLPSGIDELRNFVEHQSRICRAAKLAGLCDRDGKVLKRKSYRIYISSSSGSDSESEVEIVTRRSSPPLRSRSRLFQTRPPPPPPPGWIGPSPRPVHRGPLPPPPPPPGWRQSFPTFPPKIGAAAPSKSLLEGKMPSQTEASPDSPRGPGPLPTSRVAVVEELNVERQPPSYTEKDGAAFPLGPRVETPVPLPNNNPKDSKHSDAEGLDQAEPEGSLKSLTVSKMVEPSADENARVLSPKSSGFGMKFKNLFRTKASLEAEMKRTLADANASLSAFVIQEGESRKVPHSAFHSLEYTHMRTILSQLKDNTWFKTFSDLTQTEHRTLSLVLLKSKEDGKWIERELVVLKVLQQNRFNAWMRVIEECIGAEESGFGYRYENGRIILAIVREKQCDNVKAVVPPIPPMLPMPPSPKIIDLSDQLPAAPVPDLLPFMPRDGKIISDLTRIGTLTLSLNGGIPPSGYVRPSPGYKGASPPNSSRLESPRPFPEGSPASDAGSKTKHLKAVSEHSARKALTSYMAFTFRPAPPENTTMTPLVHIPPITWARCSLAREHEIKADLLKRIDQFKRRGISIIDMKLRLREDQSAQVTRLVEELNHIEKDEKYEHTLVELSMIEVINGSVKKPTPAVYIDVIHVVVQRAPRESVRCVDTYNRIMNPPSPPLGPPPSEVRAPFFPCGPRPNTDDIIIIQDAPLRKKDNKCRRSVASSVTYSSSSSFSGSDSDSNSGSGSDYERNRRRRRRSDSFCSDSSSDENEEDLRKRRWKMDPIEIKFSKDEKGKDIVKVLLERWIIEGKTKDGKKKAEEKDGKEN